MTTELPWTPIASGKARRVDHEHVADFYWAVSSDGRPELLLDFPSSEELPAIPHLRGLAETVSPSGGDRSRLCLHLVDSSLSDVFWRLCQDVVESTRRAEDAKSAAYIAIQRTWRWHHLLRGGGSGGLSATEQKGLLGELAVLRELLTFMTPHDAVDAWQGPLGSPKDFELGLCAIEAKARRGAAGPRVTIHGADQLDLSGLESLLLCVTDIVSAQPGHGRTLTDVVNEMADQLRQVDQSVVESFEDRLTAAGYSGSDDYSAWRWEEGDQRLYCVTDTFPRIQASSIATGIDSVSYDLDLNAIAEFQTEWTDARSVLIQQGSAT